MTAMQVLTNVPDALNDASGRLTMLPLWEDTIPRKSRDKASSRNMTPVGITATNRPRGFRNLRACKT